VHDDDDSIFNASGKSVPKFSLIVNILLDIELDNNKNNNSKTKENVHILSQ